MKIDDALVTAITRELVKRLGSGEVLAPAVKKPLVIAGDVSSLQSSTRSSLEAEYDIQWHDSLEADFPDNAEALVAKLSIQALARLAEGDAGCTPEGVLLLWALLRGKRPVILEDGVEWRGFKGTLSPALTAKFNAHEKSLTSYGAVFVREADALRVLTGGSSASGPGPIVTSGKISAPVSVPPGGAKGKRVIGEVELIRLCPEAGGFGQALEIGPRDILTPLAKDYVAKMLIAVQRTG
jgi:ethanolamine utilization protein